MREKAYVLVFTLVVTAVFVGGVSAFNVAVGERIALNQKVAQQRVVLRVLGDTEVDALADRAVADRFARAVEVHTVAKAQGEDEFKYYSRPAENPDLYAFPVWGQGFWGPISGYMAVDPVRDAIVAVAFPKAGNSETPGLGGRISEAWFEEQFAGLSLRKGEDGAFLHMTPPDTPNSDTEYDAITGATETSRSVEKLINQSIARFLQRTGREGPQ